MDIIVKFLSFTVAQNEQKLRLDKFLAQKAENLSRSKIKQIIEKGQVKINNIVIKEASFKVNHGDNIDIEVLQYHGSVITPQKVNFEIIYEDEYLLVINKPAGLTVHPGAGAHDNTLVNGLVMHCGDKLSNVADHARPGIVHRLDKNTSGLLMVAKDNETHMALSKALAVREIKRCYLALIYGVPSSKIGTVKTQYGRAKRDRQKWTVLRTGGKVAVTHYKVISNYGDGTISLIECTLETGRTHQIRVHMNYIGQPVIGDPSYGRDKNYNLNALPPKAQMLIKQLKRQALHAYKLSFVHPQTQQIMNYEIPLPLEMKEIIDSCN